jgi:hypothetical protein
MTLAIEVDRGRSQLVCESGGRKSVLIDLGTGMASFAFSRDGRSWTSRYTNAPMDGQSATELASETVWVRFVSPVSGDVVEQASSGPPAAWLRLNRDF